MSNAPTNVLFVGNLEGDVDRKLLYELACQAGPVVSVTIPTGEGGRNKGYGFVEYQDVEAATYAIKLFEGLVRLRGRLLRVAYGKGTGRSTAAAQASTPAAAAAQGDGAAAQQAGPPREEAAATAAQQWAQAPPAPPPQDVRFAGNAPTPPLQPYAMNHQPDTSGTPPPPWNGSGPGGQAQQGLQQFYYQHQQQQPQQQPPLQQQQQQQYQGYHSAAPPLYPSQSYHPQQQQQQTWGRY